MMIKQDQINNQKSLAIASPVATSTPSPRPPESDHNKFKPIAQSDRVDGAQLFRLLALATHEPRDRREHWAGANHPSPQYHSLYSTHRTLTERTHDRRGGIIKIDRAM